MSVFLPGVGAGWCGGRRCGGVALIGVDGHAVGPVAADDDRVDAEHPDQAVDALPGVRRGVDEGVRVDDQRAAAAGQEALVMHRGQAGAGGEADPQVGEQRPADRVPGPPGSGS